MYNFIYLFLLLKKKKKIVLYPLQIFLNYKCVLLISGVLIVNVSFVLATATLYRYCILINFKKKIII